MSTVLLWNPLTVKPDTGYPAKQIGRYPAAGYPANSVSGATLDYDKIIIDNEVNTIYVLLRYFVRVNIISLLSKMILGHMNSIG